MAVLGAPLVSLQAIVCCAGNLFLGVRGGKCAPFLLDGDVRIPYLPVHSVCAFGAAAACWQGRLCIILIFVQIPGATGLYPLLIETPDFFQAVYPVFPFTYGINALRETIGGFYGLQWLGEVGMLLLYFLAFFVIGFLLTPLPHQCESYVRQADCRERYLERRRSKTSCAPLSYGPAVPCFG